MPFVSNYVINRGNFHLKLLRRFKDIAVFVAGFFILSHPVVVIGANDICQKDVSASVTVIVS